MFLTSFGCARQRKKKIKRELFHCEGKEKKYTQFIFLLAKKKKSRSTYVFRLKLIHNPSTFSTRVSQLSCIESIKKGHYYRLKKEQKDQWKERKKKIVTPDRKGLRNPGVIKHIVSLIPGNKGK